MRVQDIFPVVIATGFHLFPFRTEKLSPTAPMVLHTRGRVGRRHFTTSLETRKRLGALLRLEGEGRSGGVGNERSRRGETSESIDLYRSYIVEFVLSYHFVVSKWLDFALKNDEKRGYKWV